MLRGHFSREPKLIAMGVSLVFSIDPRAHGVVGLSRPLSMREVLGSIPNVSIFFFNNVSRDVVGSNFKARNVHSTVQLIFYDLIRYSIFRDVSHRIYVPHFISDKDQRSGGS